MKLLCDQIFSEGGRVSALDAIPKKMSDLYKLTIKRISDGGRNQEVLDLLHLLAEAKASLNIQAISEFLAIPTARADAAVDACREMLFDDPFTADVEEFQLFHGSLREWLRDNHRKETRKMAQRLADRCFDYTAIEDESAHKYALAHEANHLFDQNDHERLWTLMKDEAYRKTQIEMSSKYTASFNAIKKAIEIYIQRDGETSEDDARLCWLVLRAGELAHQAKTDITIAFEWALNRPLDDRKRIDDALDRLKVLDEEDFFKALVLMLWLEAERQDDLPSDKRRHEYALRILEEADQRISEGISSVEWTSFLDVRFMAWWTRKVLDIFPIADSNSFFRFINHLVDYAKKEYISQFKNEIKRDILSLLATRLRMRKSPQRCKLPSLLHIRLENS